MEEDFETKLQRALMRRIIRLGIDAGFLTAGDIETIIRHSLPEKWGREKKEKFLEKYLYV